MAGNGFRELIYVCKRLKRLNKGWMWADLSGVGSDELALLDLVSPLHAHAPPLCIAIAKKHESRRSAYKREAGRAARGRLI
jgi:hypothetical protein